MITRRRFLTAVTGGLLVAPLAADAQQAGKVSRIGFLGVRSPSDTAPQLDPFRQGLRDLGWVEGQNIVIEYRWAHGRLDRLPDLAMELVHLEVDVIVTHSTPGVLAAKQATSTIPVVMTAVSDPVGSGIIASLARPGRNITGLAAYAGLEVVGKMLELLKEVVPKVSRVAVLSNPANRGHALALKEAETSARALGVRLQTLEARGPNEFHSAFAAMARERAGALFVLPDPIFFAHRTQLADLAAKNRLPSIYGLREHVDAGGLLAYAPSLTDMYRRAATYVDKILKGAKLGDLPVEQPTKFELVVNLKTAKALRLTIPQSVLFRADAVVQ